MNKQIIVLVILLASFNSVASSEMLDIKADNIVVDRIKNTMLFNDNVELVFEEILLTTSKIIVTLQSKMDDNGNSKNEIHSIEIPGRLSAVLIDGTGIIIADKAYYNAEASMLTFSGNVRSEYQGRIITTNELKLYVTPRF